MNNIPTGNLDDDGKVDGVDFIDWLKTACMDAEGSSAYGNGRDRPYNGQIHTTFGERGRTQVTGLTMRDLMDCFVGAMLDCVGEEQPDLYHKADRAVVEDMFKVEDMNKIDPLAWWQNMHCRIEKMMGIYPNVTPFD